MQNDLDRIDFYEFIENMKEIILDQLIYYRFYYATVKINADAVDQKGAVFVECLDLGAKDPLSYIRAIPIQAHRTAIFPKIGDVGILFFQNADQSQPRFLSTTQELFIMTQPVQMKHTIIETATVGSKLDVDELTGFTMESKSVTGVTAAVEPTVLGTQLKTVMDYAFDTFGILIDHLIKIYELMMTHTHPTPTGPSGPAMPPTPGNCTAKTADLVSSKVDVQAKKIAYSAPGKLLSPSNKNN